VFRKLAWLIPVLVLLPVAAAPVVLDAGVRSEFRIRPNVGDWHCRAGDDLRWAQPDFDDRDWAACAADSPPPVGISWRRLHLRLSKTAAASHLSIGTILPPASVLYKNGQEIAASGRFGKKPRYPMPVYRIIPLPTLGNSVPAEVVFAIRMQHSEATKIWANTRLMLQDGGFVDLELGSESLLQQKQLYTFFHLADSIPSSVVGLLALLLGAYVLRLWSAQRSHWEYLWFTLIAAFFNFRATIHLIELGISMDANWSMALNTGFAPELLLPPFFWTFFHRRVPKAVAIYTASIFAIRLLGTLWVPTLYMLPWMWLGTIPCMLLPLVVTFQEVSRGNREARVLAPTMIFYGVLIIWVNLALALKTAFPVWQIGEVKLTAIQIGQTIFLLTTAVALADRARRTSMERARLAGEFSAARQVQQLLVPAPSMTAGQYQMESAYVPSDQVGGDFFQLVPNEDGGLLLVIGDVTGKGLKAALVVSVIVGALQNRRSDGPSSILSELNSILLGRSEGGFTTCCCALFTADGRLTIANAGHLAPYRNGVEIETPPALPLGIDADARWTEMHLEVEPGDRVLWVSDGVIEARNGKRDLLGFERAQALAMRSPSEIARAAQQFGQEDDITVVSITRQPVPVYVA
jgi:stage II sporulation SpoE-like protein